MRGEAVLRVDLGAYVARKGTLRAPAGNDEPTDDVEEVSNYLTALAYARQQFRSEKGLPLSTRHLNEAHRRLMKGVRGSTKQPANCAAAIARSAMLGISTAY